MAKAKKTTSKKSVVKKPVVKKEVKKEAKKEKVVKTKEVKTVLQAKSTHVEVPYVPRKIDRLPPPK